MTLAHTVTEPAEDTQSSLHAVQWQANKACHESDIDRLAWTFCAICHQRVFKSVLTLPSGGLQPPHSRALPGVSVHQCVPARALVPQSASAGCT